MSNQSEVMQADDQFFAALKGGDAASLKAALTDDFMLVDVMGGAENPKSALLDMIGSGQLKFESITPSERKVRIYGGAAIVIGRTEMSIRMGPDAVSTKSRYTHVFVKSEGGWRLASAQGTPLKE